MLNKNYRHIIITLFAVMLMSAMTLCSIFAISAKSSEVLGGNAVSVTVSPSKDSYSENDEIILRLDLIALSENIDDISIESKLPDGFTYTSGSSSSQEADSPELYESGVSYISFKYNPALVSDTVSDTESGTESDEGFDLSYDTSGSPETSYTVSLISTNTSVDTLGTENIKTNETIFQADTRDSLRSEISSQTSDILSGKYIAAIVIIAVAAVTTAVMIIIRKARNVCTFILVAAISLPMIAAGISVADAESWTTDGTQTITIKQEFTMNEKKYECSINIICKTEESAMQKYDIYADAANGDDNAAGSLDKPLATIEKAAEKAKEYLSGADKCNVTIYLREGEYFTAGIEFNGEEYGNPDSKINISAYNNENVTVSGNKYIPASGFTKAQGKEYYICQLPEEGAEYPRFEDFYVNGKLAKLASTDTVSKIAVAIQNEADRSDPANAVNGLYLNKEFFEQFADSPELTPMRICMQVEWEYHMLRVKSVDFSDTTNADNEELVRVTFNDTDWSRFVSGYNGVLSILNREYSFENALAFVDCGGEYFYDNTTGTIYYYPEDGVDISSASFAYPCSEVLISFRNLRGASVYGIDFTGTTSNFITNNGYISGQANHTHLAGHLKNAAILSEKASNVRIDSCKFSELGGNGVMFAQNSDSVAVINNSFTDISMSAILVGKAGLTWTDETENRNVTIANNIIDGIGTRYHSSAALYIAKIDGLKILHNTITNVAYSAISAGWTWSPGNGIPGETEINIYNAEIAYNYIKKYMQILRDGGGIYVVGGNAAIEYTELFNSIHNNYVDRGNGSSGQPGIYLDGASSNWHVYHNVSVNMQTPIFAQYDVIPQYIHNATIENNFSLIDLPVRNASEERNVIQINNISDITMKDLVKHYPEAGEIIDNSGILK